MIEIRNLPEDAALHAIDNGEFPESVLSTSEFVAVIMTQGWCPDWRLMETWLRRIDKTESGREIDLAIFQFLYDEVEFFDRFRVFKESVFRNDEIPYVRYYRQGRLIADSNAVMRGRFFRLLGQ